MKSRPMNRALFYERRSDDGQEASLRQQFDWAKSTASKLSVSFRGTYADIETMQRKKLHNLQDIYLDDAVSGGDLTRPGLRQFLRDAIADRTVSHVYVFKRDRLGRPQGLIEMMGLEHQLMASGITLVTHDRTYTPEDIKDNELVYLISGLVEYQEHGRFSPRLGDRIVFVQQSMAARGLSTGGRAPYGFGRALVGANDEFVQWLAHGENVRRAGHHVRFLPHDEEKIAIWCMMLEWREAGESCKRIAARLNQMGIPSPDNGRTRRDHGAEYRVPGKWHPNTVRDICSNPIISGIKEYGRRSEGRYRRVGPDGPRELDEHDLRPDGQPKLLENPEEVRVRSSSGGKAYFGAERWRAIQPKKDEDLAEVRRRSGRKATNPERYPLSTRIIDLTDGCGSVMHGITYGKTPKYVCGRYYNSGYTECSHNSVAASPLATMLVDALVELVNKAGGRETIRERLLEKARAAAEADTAPQEPHELVLLRKRLTEIDGDIATAERRMATERDDARYAAIAKTFDSLVKERADVDRQINALAVPPPTAASSVTPEEQVDALMATIDDLGALAGDTNANDRIRQLVLRLGIFIGLDFEERMWGKRPIRALRRGVIAFSADNLPVRIHGHSRAEGQLAENTNGGGETAADDHTQSAPACCRGPSADAGTRRGARGRKGRTDEPDSGSEQTHQGTNVGATGFEPATS
jgi:predicted site-specific integrase-resolvase